MIISGKFKKNESIIMLIFSILDLTCVALNQMAGVIVFSTIIVTMLGYIVIRTVANKEKVKLIDIIAIILSIIDIMLTSVLLFYGGFFISGLKTVVLFSRVITRTKIINTAKTTVPVIGTYFKFIRRNIMKDMKMSFVQKGGLIGFVLAITMVIVGRYVPDLAISGTELNTLLQEIGLIIGAPSGLLAGIATGLKKGDATANQIKKLNVDKTKIDAKIKKLQTPIK